MLTITLVGFEALAISTVMPIVARELGGLELYGWVFSAFFLGSLIGIVVVGGAIDRGGLAVPFAAGLGLFAIGLLAGGLAPSMPILVAARFVQGLGAGTIQPIAYVAIGRTLPERLRPRMFAVLSTAWVLPGVIGPAIAGTVGEVAGWRYVFLGLLPLIALAAALTLGALRNVADAPPVADEAAAAARRGRLPLAIAVAVGAGMLTVGLTSGEPLPTIVLSVAGLLIGIFALRRLTPPGTLVARPVLPAAVLLRGILTCMFFGVDAFVALTLVGWRGVSATQAGIALTAATILWTAGAWIQARGATRWPTYRFVQVGFAVTLLGLAGMLLVLEPDGDLADRHPRLRGGRPGHGPGLFAPRADRASRGHRRRPGAATSALSLTDSLGTALGHGHHRSDRRREPAGDRRPAAGLAAGFMVALAIGLGGLSLTGRLRSRTAIGRGHGPVARVAAVVMAGSLR